MVAFSLISFSSLTNSTRKLSSSEASQVVGGLVFQPGGAAPGWCLGNLLCVVSEQPCPDDTPLCRGYDIDDVDSTYKYYCIAADDATVSCTTSAAGPCATYTTCFFFVGIPGHPELGICAPNLSGVTHSGSVNCTDGSGAY